MRQLNIDELIVQINNLAQKTTLADKNHYQQNLLQIWNFLNYQNISKRVLEKIENDYQKLYISLIDKGFKNQQKLSLLETHELQGAFGYFEIKHLLAKENLHIYNVFSLSNDWYGIRRSMDDSKEVFNSNFLEPFIELIIWYLEESTSYNSKDYFSKNEVELFKEKLDEITEMLYSIKDGQEIIFGEIEDLREQLLNAKKKNWTEMFKGKFYDFVFNKFITEEMFNEIFNILTGQEKSAISGYIKSLTS
jgi:hypothetical protein